MMQDAVKAFATVVKELHAATEIQPIPIRCQSNNPGWSQGQDIITALDQVYQLLSIL